MTETEHTFEYDVTEDGKVLSCSSNWRGYGQRELAQIIHNDGYLTVRLVVHGKRVRRKVHRLVAEKYLGPQPSPAHEVRHLDGNRLNNKAANLAWGTRKQNADDREAHGRTSRGAAHSQSIKNSNHANGVRAFIARQKAQVENV